MVEIDSYGFKGRTFTPGYFIWTLIDIYLKPNYGC